MSKYLVYIMKCADGTLYTGITTDIHRRTQEHNNGTGAKYTRSRRPVVPVYCEECKDRSAALKREAEIKKLPKSQKNELISHCDFNFDE